MALVSTTPVSGSIISRGALLEVVWSGGPLPQITYRSGTGPDEIISTPTFTSATYGNGYTGSYTIDGGNTVHTFKRDAGWPDNQFTIIVFDFLGTGAEDQLNFTILTEGQYPPDMQPFTEPAEGGTAGTIQILNSGSLLGSATAIDLQDNLTAILNGDTAEVDAAAGGGSGAGSVSGTIGIWNKGSTVANPQNETTAAQTFDVDSGLPFSTTSIRVHSQAPPGGD